MRYGMTASLLATAGNELQNGAAEPSGKKSIPPRLENRHQKTILRLDHDLAGRWLIAEIRWAGRSNVFHAMN